MYAQDACIQRRDHPRSVDDARRVHIVEGLNALVERLADSCKFVADRFGGDLLQLAHATGRHHHAKERPLLAEAPAVMGKWRLKMAPCHQLLDLVAVLEKLAGVLRSQPAHDWLFAPNDSLDHHKPVDLLRTGEFRRVLGAIDAMSEGVFIT
jgi:hypothetical protein